MGGVDRNDRMIGTYSSVDTNVQIVKTSQVYVQHHVFGYTIQHKLKVRDISFICNCELALGTKILIVNYACSQTFHHHCSGLITQTNCF